MSSATLDCDPFTCQISHAARTFGDVGETFNVDSCSWSVHHQVCRPSPRLGCGCSTTILFPARVMISCAYQSGQKEMS